MKLTDAQLERLAQLGVKYPWDPGDVWPLVERIDELERLVRDLKRDQRDLQVALNRQGGR